MPIIIADYDPQWPVHFLQVQQDLTAALGELAIAIEHVGSTSVPGLAAKPIIDIGVVIESPDQLPAAIERLASIGYEHQGDLGIVGRQAFRTPPGGPARHVYVCMKDAIPLREHIAFRDYLRQHPQVANDYANLKRELANSVGDDRDAYTNRKKAFVREVLSRCSEGNAEIPEFGECLPDVSYILRPGGYAVIYRDDGMMAICKTHRGYFLPGGGQDPNESPENAAIREAYEECGLRIRVLAHVGVADQLVYAVSENKYFRKRCTFFTAQIIAQESNGEDDHELVWMTAMQASTLLSHESQHWAVIRYAENEQCPRLGFTR